MGVAIERGLGTVEVRAAAGRIEQALRRNGRSAARTLVPSPGQEDGPLPPVLLLLTLVTGVLNAVSYLSLGNVFVGVMTGNVLLLGFAIAGAEAPSVGAVLLALGAFLFGAMSAGRLTSRQADNRGRLLAVGTLVECLFLAGALAVGLVVADAGEQAAYQLIVLLALAMGVQNAVARKLAVADLTTTVLTLTLTGLVSDPPSGRPAPEGRRVVAVVTMFLGALLGGLLTLQVSLASALALALLLAAVASASMFLLARSGLAWTKPDQ